MLIKYWPRPITFSLRMHIPTEFLEAELEHLGGHCSKRKRGRGGAPSSPPSAVVSLATNGGFGFGIGIGAARTPAPARSALNVATLHGVGGGERRQIQIGKDEARRRRCGGGGTGRGERKRDMEK